MTPGAVKDSIRYRNMMGVALQACDQMLWKHRWQTLDRRAVAADRAGSAVVRRSRRQ